jgi:hypothetical protein
MSFIQDIIVSITNVTNKLRGRVFDPLILGTGASAIGTVTVTTQAELLEAGYTSTDAEYLALGKMLSGDTVPDRVIVRRKADATTYTDALNALVAGGTAFFYVTITSRDVDDIHEVAAWAQSNKYLFVGCSADKAVKGTKGYQAVDLGSAKAGGDNTGLSGSTVYGMTVLLNEGTDDEVEKIVLVTGSAATTYTTLLTQINNDLGGDATAELVSGDLRVTSDLYGTNSSVAITDGATGADSNLLATLTGFVAISTAVDGTLKSETWAAVLVHNNAAADYPDMQWVGTMAPKVKGKATWNDKKLPGQNAGNWTLSELVEIRGSGESGRAQAIQTQAGATFVNEGITLGGRYIDEIEFEAWVKDQIELEILNLRLSVDKIPLDNVGIPLVEACVRKVLEQGARNGGIARAVEAVEKDRSDDKVWQYKVTAPTRSQLSTIDVANRTLRGIEFVYYSSGAVHQVRVSGIVTV